MTHRFDDRYYGRADVERLSPFSEPTRYRLEQAGRFPRRVHVSTRMVFWLRAEIDRWVLDPEGWRPTEADARARAEMGGDQRAE
jgi:predicted DNA-binding transcriptional regulator AlpA